MAKKYKCPFAKCTYETHEVTDALAAVMLLVHSQGTHTTPGVDAAAPSITPNMKLKKVQHPTISTAGSSEDWSYFLARWGDCVTAMNSSAKALHKTRVVALPIKLALKSWKPLRNLLCRKKTQWLLECNSTTCARTRTKRSRSFGTGFRGQAGVCKFQVTCRGCNAEVNYTENVLHDVLTRSLANSEIQLDLLGDRNQDMSPEEVFQFPEAKEAG